VEGAGRLAAPIAAALLPVLLVWGCARPVSGPPAIADGVPCVACGMPVHDLALACERKIAGGWRIYDSVECLLRDAAATPGGASYLADYDRRALHAADSLWVVKGSFPTPMGGGLAAFLDRAAADTVAARTGGRVGRLGEFGGVGAVGDGAGVAGANSTAARPPAGSGS
jgi:nitrous oxide reductase accessory protein NosL